MQIQQAVWNLGNFSAQSKTMEQVPCLKRLQKSCDTVSFRSRILAPKAFGISFRLPQDVWHQLNEVMDLQKTDAAAVAQEALNLLIAYYLAKKPASQLVLYPEADKTKWFPLLRYRDAGAHYQDILFPGHHMASPQLDPDALDMIRSCAETHQALKPEMLQPAIPENPFYLKVRNRSNVLQGTWSGENKSSSTSLPEPDNQVLQEFLCDAIFLYHTAFLAMIKYQDQHISVGLYSPTKNGFKIDHVMGLDSTEFPVSS